MAFGWPTVNCAATRMLDVAVPLAAAHARRGAYLVHAAARVASEGALAPSSAVKSDATWIGLPPVSRTELAITTAYVCPGVNVCPPGILRPSQLLQM